MSVMVSSEPALPDLEPDRLQMLFAVKSGPYIVFEDEDHLVVHKPADMHSVRKGVSSHALASAVVPESLQEWLLDAVPVLGMFSVHSSVKGCRTDSGMLSRLDAPTSGLILVAKNIPSLLRLHEAQAQGRIRKTYVLAASLSVRPVPGARPDWSSAASGLTGQFRVLSAKRDVFQQQKEPALQSCSLSEEFFLVESKFRPYGPGRKRVAPVAPEIQLPSGIEVAPGIYATWFKAIASGGKGSFRTDRNALQFYMASIRAGFRHQIRVHAAWSGIPILGDALYGGETAQRLYLHSYSVEFPVREGETLCVRDKS